MEIAKIFSNEIWGEIFSHLDDHNLLRVAQVNNQLRSLIILNYFWIKYVNDNYKHSKINIYESVLESINIIHRMAIFLNELNNNVSSECILSDKKYYIDKCPYNQRSCDEYDIETELLMEICGTVKYSQCKIIYSN